MLVDTRGFYHDRRRLSRTLLISRPCGRDQASRRSNILIHNLASRSCREQHSPNFDTTPTLMQPGHIEAYEARARGVKHLTLQGRPPSYNAVEHSLERCLLFRRFGTRLTFRCPNFTSPRVCRSTTSTLWTGIMPFRDYHLYRSWLILVHHRWARTFAKPI